LKGNFEIIKSLKSQLRFELIKFETNDYFVNDAKIQGEIKNIYFFKDNGLIARF